MHIHKLFIHNLVANNLFYVSVNNKHQCNATILFASLRIQNNNNTH